MQKIAADHQKKLTPLNGEIALSNHGHGSLCFAVVVARLEDQFEVDPFSTSEDGNFPATLGEFVRPDENATK
jgi:hypothetical protein